MDSLGVIEVSSIAFGAELADFMVKAAEVDLLRAAPICSGRFLIYIAGDREAVETSVTIARDSEKKVIGSFVISHISPQVTAALKKSEAALIGEALGVVESRFVSQALYAADKAVKRSHVRLLKFVSGQGIAGKAFFILSGDVAAVREAVSAAREVLGTKLIEAVVIPSPDSSLARALTGAVR